MDENRFHIQGANTLTLPAEDAEKLIALGDGECALLYLHILRAGGALNVPAAARAMGRTGEQIIAAARRLTQAGILADSGTPLPGPDELPEYEPKEIVRLSREDGTFRALVGECARVLGHTLSTPDLSTLYGIYERLGLSAETILLLINHCAEKLRRRYGEGRLPTMRAIEKEAYYWANRDILTVEQAEEYLAELSRRESETEKIRTALGLSGRALSPTERKYIESWLSMGYGAETLSIAYDRTVVGTGKLTWAYMDKIVKTWCEKKLFTPEQIEKGDTRTQRAKSTPKPADTAPRRGGGDDLSRLEIILNKIGGKE